LRLVENPNFNDEKLLNILRSDLVNVNNLDVITLSRELYKKNYSKSGFKLSLWELIKNIDIDYSVVENASEDEKKALFETDLEEKYRYFKDIIEFRKLILEFNSELGLY
jgi:hypothetical protein